MVAVCGIAMGAFGAWALLAPASFADAIDFPPANEHLLHDVGAFQLGIAATLLSAVLVEDSVTVALIGFLTADVIHTVNHLTDLTLGGHATDALLLGALAVVAFGALLLRLRSDRPSNQTDEE
ncbi:hypothetical protein [Modestobacter altitudinis]|uniref:hypothetical protein n=1 Tax=Modestobacter altitudinis TaxID=2213158 RepID=UPI00110D0C64|nr:hypothetical protein [Modestobacter altitudinis]